MAGINFNDVDALPLTQGSADPASNDGAALGASGTAWSDLFLADGGTINVNEGAGVISCTTGAFDVSTGTFTIGTSTAISSILDEDNMASDSATALATQQSIKAYVDSQAHTPVAAQYVTLATDATLTDERVLTGTANQITITDNGAGSTVVLSTPQDLDSEATVTFGTLTLDSDSAEALLVRKNGDLGDVFSVDTVSDLVRVLVDGSTAFGVGSSALVQMGYNSTLSRPDISSSAGNIGITGNSSSNVVVRLGANTSSEQFVVEADDGGGGTLTRVTVDGDSIRTDFTSTGVEIDTAGASTTGLTLKNGMTDLGFLQLRSGDTSGAAITLKNNQSEWFIFSQAGLLQTDRGWRFRDEESSGTTLFELRSDGRAQFTIPSVADAFYVSTGSDTFIDVEPGTSMVFGSSNVNHTSEVWGSTVDLVGQESQTDAIHLRDQATTPRTYLKADSQNARVYIGDNSESIAVTLDSTVTLTTATANSVLYVNASGVLTSTANPADGELLVGSSGSNPVLATLTGTTDQVVVTNGTGSITLSTPQDIATSSSPTFVGVTLSGLTASRLMSTDGGSASSSVTDLTSWIAGTADQVSVADDGDGSVTLSTPQSIATTSSPTFAGLTITGATSLGTGTKSEGLQVADVQEVQTTDATETTCGSLTLLDENTYLITAKIVGVQSTGANRAAYELKAVAYRTGAGSATLQGATVATIQEESDTDWDADIDVSGNDVRVRVTGKGSTTIEWGCSLSYVNMSN